MVIHSLQQNFQRILALKNRRSHLVAFIERFHILMAGIYQRLE